MSDPNREGPFTCCGSKMEAVYFDFTVEPLIAAWVCAKGCGVWRYGPSRDETQLRALAERLMAKRLQERT